MINHFRTRLMNLSDTSIVSEYICPSFTAVSLPTPLADFRALLFPSGTRSDVLSRATAYTTLLAGNNLDEVFSLYDSRITYRLSDLFTFQTGLVDLVALSNTIIFNSVSVTMLNYGANNSKYVNMYNSSPITLQRLAGLIAAYSYKLT